jgi:hypothetical protein
VRAVDARTSVGSIVGTLLATGQDLDLLDAPVQPADQGDSGPNPDHGRLTEVFAILRDASPVQRPELLCIQGQMTLKVS